MFLHFKDTLQILGVLSLILSNVLIASFCEPLMKIFIQYVKRKMNRNVKLILLGIIIVLLYKLEITTVQVQRYVKEPLVEL